LGLEIDDALIALTPAAILATAQLQGSIVSAPIDAEMKDGDEVSTPKPSGSQDEAPACIDPKVLTYGQVPTPGSDGPSSSKA
jgi:hypothetical protein